MKGNRFCFGRGVVPTIVGITALSSTALAQAGYAIGDSSGGGPVRMARTSDFVGTVEWRPSSTVDWAVASMNVPVRQGAELWAKGGSRAELQFDDGSAMRLGADGISVLQTMYSDSNGEFTEIKLENGLLTIHLRTKLSEYQVDTPQCSVKAFGPAVVRVGVNGSTVEAVVESGQAQAESSRGSCTLEAGHRIDLGGSSQILSESAIRTAPAQDDWDHWNEERDQSSFHENANLPPDINLCAGNLDASGSWNEDPKYGRVWCPKEASDWRPYQDGSWAWVSPFGWTWCGNESWGWAPYHYGTWVHESYGWGWRPGPQAQYWSPAVVDFCDDGENVAWAPLAPWEVQYPAEVSIGFGSGDWSLSFSIGQAACWYPNGNQCESRPWDNQFANEGWNYYGQGQLGAYYGGAADGSNGYGQNRFQPYNAYHENGAMYASRSSFAHGGRFSPVDSSHLGIFQRGQGYNSAPSGSQISGPLGLRPSGNAFVASHHFAAAGPPSSLAERSVYRPNLAANIARQASRPGHAVANQTRVADHQPANTKGNAGSATRRATSVASKENGAMTHAESKVTRSTLHAIHAAGNHATRGATHAKAPTTHNTARRTASTTRRASASHAATHRTTHASQPHERAVRTATTRRFNSAPRSSGGGRQSSRPSFGGGHSSGRSGSSSPRSSGGGRQSSGSRPSGQGRSSHGGSTGQHGGGSHASARTTRKG